MKLTNLDASFIKQVIEKDSEYRERVLGISEADGVMFQCPLCASNKEPGEENGRKFFRGAHYVICWFTGRVPDTLGPGPGRWNPSGTSLEDLTFVGPGSVSVFLKSGCGWHGFVRKGEATLS